MKNIRKIEKILGSHDVTYEIYVNRAVIEVYDDSIKRNFEIAFEYNGTFENFVAEYRKAVDKYTFEDTIPMYIKIKDRKDVNMTMEDFISEHKKTRVKMINIYNDMKKI